MTAQYFFGMVTLSGVALAAVMFAGFALDNMSSGRRRTRRAR